MSIDTIYLTPKQLASRWRVDSRTLAGQRYQGIGPAYVKIGGVVRYSLEDVEAYEKRVTTSEQA